MLKNKIYINSLWILQQLRDFKLIHGTEYLKMDYSKNKYQYDEHGFILN